MITRLESVNEYWELHIDEYYTVFIKYISKTDPSQDTQVFCNCKNEAGARWWIAEQKARAPNTREGFYARLISKLPVVPKPAPKSTKKRLEAVKQRLEAIKEPKQLGPQGPFKRKVRI